MNSFKIKFRGTRGSYPTPKQNFLKYGANTACVEVRLGDRLVILDAGTGIVDIGTDEIKNSIIEKDKKPNKTTIILSHIHLDHIQGLQFYKPLFIQGSKINLFGPGNQDEDLKEILKTVLFDKVFPLSLDEIRSSFKINDFCQNDVIKITQDGEAEIYNIDEDIKKDKEDIIITAYKTMAHPKNGSMSIKIEYNSKTLVYATDKESYVGMDKNFIRFAYGCDCLIHDAQYTYYDYINPINPKQGFGHSTYEMAIDTAKLSKAKRLFFFHYDPEYDDNKLMSLEKEFKQNTKEGRIEFAKENDEIIL